MTRRPMEARAASHKGLVLTKAVFRAATLLGLNQRDVAAVLGISASSVSRLAGHSKVLSPSTNEGKRALMFLRVFRSLDSLFGGETEQMRTWLWSRNYHLCDVPLHLVKDIGGVVHVADYLDAMRGTY